MARLVNVWRDDDPVELASKQMPLIVDENLTVSARAHTSARTRAHGTPIYPIVDTGARLLGGHRSRNVALHYRSVRAPRGTSLT